MTTVRRRCFLADRAVPGTENVAKQTVKNKKNKRIRKTYENYIFIIPFVTPEFLSKKHLNLGQGLEFLKFGPGNRGPNQQNQRKNKRTYNKKQRKIYKKFRVRDPYFLLKNFLFNIFSVFLLLFITNN